VLSDPQTVTEIVPLISKYANSQNKVNGADLSASGKFHRQMEGLSRTVWAPPISGMDRGTHWYYERARGSYLDDKARQGTAKKQQEWTENNPRDGKFTKTELAKYEHTWLGLPHLVCLGAEKNFLAFAERLEDEGEPLVDLNYFKHTVAKAILSRTAEKLFSTLQLDGYRANTVPYALSWLAERSSHRIDLDFVWEKQRVPAETQEAMKIVCQAAHRHLTQTIGNVGEWSKKTECWDEFRNKDTTVSSHWEQEWANTSYLAISSESEALKREWDQLRTQFVEDPRTLGELEALTGREWIARHRGDEARTHAARTWSELKGPGGRRYKNIRAFLELFSAAAKLAGDR
jgi:hypothetical protein